MLCSNKSWKGLTFVERTCSYYFSYVLYIYMFSGFYTITYISAYIIFDMSWLSLDIDGNLYVHSESLYYLIGLSQIRHGKVNYFKIWL